MANYKITSCWIHRIMRLPRCILASFQDRRSSLAIAILERSRSRYPNSSAYIFHYPIFAIFLSSSFLLDIYLIRDSKFSDFYLWTLTYSINPLHSNVIYSIFLNCKRCIENVIIFLFRKRRTMWKSDFKRMSYSIRNDTLIKFFFITQLC